MGRRMRVGGLVVMAALASACKKAPLARAGDGPLPEGKVAKVFTHFCEVRASLTPERARFGIDMKTFVTFRATTECDRRLTLGVGEMANDLGRPETYRMSAVDSEGESVPIRSAGENQGGATSHAVFSREEPLVQRLYVPMWLTFPRPGRYEIIVQKSLILGERADGGASAIDGEEWLPMTVSTFVDVE